MAPTLTPTNTLDITLAAATALPPSSNNITLEEVRLKVLEVLLDLAKVEANNDIDRRTTFAVLVLVIGMVGLFAYMIYSKSVCISDLDFHLD
jgi:hypothetical protein